MDRHRLIKHKWKLLKPHVEITHVCITPIAQIIEEEKKAALKLLEKEFSGIEYYNKQMIICVESPKKALYFELPEVYKIDLIYISATGKRRLERMLVGSTTDYVVNNAPCDVMVVR
jgi:nucleotide-binding universal stress UspA family protein